MKKIWSLITTFLLILIMIPATPVKADDDLSSTLVMYGGVVQNSNGGYSGLYAVRQALYKKPQSYVTSSDTPSMVNNPSHVTNWGNAETLNWAKSNPNANVFNGTALKSTLAYFTLDVSGNVTIVLQNEVVVERLNVYYIIAGLASNNEGDTSMVMCKTSSTPFICDNAKNISSPDSTVSGSWQTVSKNGKSMSYNEGNLTAAGFDKVVTASGVTTYSGFNVIENMSQANKQHAISLGSYVVLTMSVRNLAEAEGMENDNVYYINTTMPSNMTFNYVTTETTSGKTYGNIYENAHNNISEAAYNSRNVALGAYVDRFAALINNAPSALDNEGLQTMLEYFENYIKPIVIIGLGVFLIVRGTLLIIAIIKASDEPEVRKESIKHLVTLFVSLAVIILLVWNMKDIIEILAEFIMGM